MTVRGIVARLRIELRAALRDRGLVAAANSLRGAVALEPGGPSAVFGRLGEVPVYRRLAALDTLDYAERTIWSDATGFELAPRRRLIGEASRLEGVADDAYDAVLASHVVEHLANPLGALAEWKRVVRPGGHLLLVVPHRDGTFDHRRPVTTLDHLRADREAQSDEGDLSHLDEVLTLHDLARDPGAPSRQVFEERCRQNLATRAMHHHVFTSRSVVEMCQAAGLELLLLRAVLPFHVVCLCAVGPRGEDGLDAKTVDQALSRSPFASDRSGGL